MLVVTGIVQSGAAGGGLGVDAGGPFHLTSRDNSREHQNAAFAGSYSIGDGVIDRMRTNRSSFIGLLTHRAITLLAILCLMGCEGVSSTTHWTKSNAFVDERQSATELTQLISGADHREPNGDSGLEDVLNWPTQKFTPISDAQTFAVALEPERLEKAASAEPLQELKYSELEFGEMPVDEVSVFPPALAEMSFSELTQYRWQSVKDDYENFYAPANLGYMAIGFGAGAVLANTNLDESISHDFFRENFVEIANEDITQKLHSPKPLGDGYVILPLIGVIAAAQPWLDEVPLLKPLGEWGDRSARTVLVGGPFVLLMQSAIGGSRPNESPSQSHWEPFQDNNGVSGHAFVGAVPFLTAAQLTDSNILQSLCYIGSVLPGISRVNDDRHYFSQVFLGWYVALLAAQSVDQTQHASRGIRLVPLVDPDGFGLLLEKSF
jgi:hypothetical protein